MSNLFIAGHHPIADAGFPDILCPVVFLEKCNFVCPYCMNHSLVRSVVKNNIALGEVADFYLKKGETQILISGGEPCFNDYIYEYVIFLINKGFKVRLSTNGSFPEVLKKLIDKKLIFFVAMDIKTSLDNINIWRKICPQCDIISKIKQSIEILEKSGIDFEFRTTLFPPFIQKEDIVSIAEFINYNSRWVLQQFRQKQQLLGGEEVKNIIPYNNKQLNELFNLALQKHPLTKLKYV